MPESEPPQDDSSKDSEESYDYQCTSCGPDHVTRRAMFQCVDCDAKYCVACMKDHNKFPHLRSHQVLDESSMRPGVQASAAPPPVPTDRCEEHHSKVMDMFCVDHNEVCCSACIAVNHRACKKVDYIPSISNDILDSKELTETIAKSKVLQQFLQERVDSKEDNMKALDQDEKQLIADLEREKRATVERVEKIFEKSKSNVRMSHTEKSLVLIKAKDDMKKSLHKLKKHINKNDRIQGNESQIFVDMKNGQELMKAVEGQIDEDDASAVKIDLKVNISAFSEIEEKNPLVNAVAVLSLLSCYKRKYP